jgi:glutamine amidotransferase
MKDRATRSLPVFQGYSREWNANDGWGIAYYVSPNKVKLVREPEPAYSSVKFSEIIQQARSNIIISHVRWKTRGRVCEKNCHPFYDEYVGRHWIFAHNGCIGGIDYPTDRIEGDTDSAMIFQFMMDNIIQYLAQGRIRGIYPAIMDSIKKIFRRYGTGISLNFLLSDSVNLYAFHHYSGKPMYFLRREKDYGGAILISTRKLSQEDWQKIPEDRLFVVSRGEVLVLSDKYHDF